MELDKVYLCINVRNLRRNQLFLAPKGTRVENIARVVVDALKAPSFQSNLEKIDANCPVEILVYKTPDMVIGISIPDDCPTAA